MFFGARYASELLSASFDCVSPPCKDSFSLSLVEKRSTTFFMSSYMSLSFILQRYGPSLLTYFFPSLYACFAKHQESLQFVWSSKRWLSGAVEAIFISSNVLYRYCFSIYPQYFFILMASLLLTREIDFGADANLKICLANTFTLCVGSAKKMGSGILSLEDK